MKRILLTLAVLTTLFSCKKEDIKPNIIKPKTYEIRIVTTVYKQAQVYNGVKDSIYNNIDNFFVEKGDTVIFMKDNFTPMKVYLNDSLVINTTNALDGCIVK